MLRTASLIIAASIVSGCVSSKVLLTAGPGQEAIIRDGTSALISHKSHVVMLRPKTRKVQGGSRPAFAIAVKNRSSKPANLYEASITASQTVRGKTAALRIYRYDELVQEEQARQALAVFGAVLSGVGRARSAANAGYVHSTGSVNVHGTGGSAYGTYSGTTYDPLRAQRANQLAAAETAADFAAISAQGERKLHQLETQILKDNTVLPGEWYGGIVILNPPQDRDGAVTAYTITVEFDGEQHGFQISHERN